MTEENIVRYTMEEIKAKRARGESRTRLDAPDGPPLGDDFWANAVLVEGPNRKSVHLRLQSDVFDFFFQQAGGKGHIAKMQAVLKAYADAHRAS
jgi:uncharacterized protein (DUF4415 family)